MIGLLRRWRDSLVAETRMRWQARCLTCDTVFDYPGIRLGASGEPIRLMKCPTCERARLCRAEKIRRCPEAVTPLDVAKPTGSGPDRRSSHP